MLNFEEFGDKIKAPRAPGSPASLLEAADERKHRSSPRGTTHAYARCSVAGLVLAFYVKHIRSAGPEKIVSDVARLGGRMLDFEELGG